MYTSRVFSFLKSVLMLAMTEELLSSLIIFMILSIGIISIMFSLKEKICTPSAAVGSALASTYLKGLVCATAPSVIVSASSMARSRDRGSLIRLIL